MVRYLLDREATACNRPMALDKGSMIRYFSGYFSPFFIAKLADLC